MTQKLTVSLLYIQYGELGIGVSGKIPSPTLAKTINSMSTAVEKIVACNEFTLILSESSEVYVLGSNRNYQLGTDDSQSHLTPFLNPFLTGISGVGCGNSVSFFWNSTGIYGAGDNSVCPSILLFFFVSF